MSGKHPLYGDERCSGCGLTEEERAKKECCTADCPMKRLRETPEVMELRYGHLMTWRVQEQDKD